MDRRVSFFGGTTRGLITLENGHVENRSLDRDIWFDRDVDGRWLVWAFAHDGDPRHADDETQTGSIVVRSPDAIAFIELLAEMIANPPAFRHEPTFTGLVGDGDA